LNSSEPKKLERPITKLGIEFLLLSALVMLIILIVLLCSVPPISKDALTHHLAVPKLYLSHGGVYEIPSVPFSYYPMNLDLLYLIPLYFGNDIIPKFIHFIFALLTAWILFAYLRRRLGKIYGLLGSLFFLSIPIIIRLSITVYVDLGLIFFSTASLLLLFMWIEREFQLKFLIFSAVSCGLAMGTKYNGLAGFVILGLFVPFAYSRFNVGERGGFFKSAKQCLIFVLVALVVFSPWMIRDLIWTGNPIFPLFDRFFNPEHPVAHKSFGLFTYRALVYKEAWWQIALLPFRIFFQGRDGNPQFFDGKLNPFLLFLPIFAFFCLRRDHELIRREKQMLLSFAGLFFLFAFFSSALRIRYISPIISPLVILSVFGLKRVAELSWGFNVPCLRKGASAAILLMVLFPLWLNADYLLDQFRSVRPFDYLMGSLTRTEYIQRYRPEYAAMRYINNKLPVRARILFVFMGNRGYYCERDYVFDMINNMSTLENLVKGSDDPEQIFFGIKGMGVTHLLVNFDILDRWVKANFAEREQGLLARFFQRHTKLLFFKWGYGVCGLKGPAGGL